MVNANETVKIKIHNEVFKKDVRELPFSTRAMNALLRNKLYKVEDILDAQEGLSKMKGIGEGVRKEIKNTILKEEIIYCEKNKPKREVRL